jgi:adenylate cyclase
MGIGLHSGPVMSGNVGSARRLEYAAIGDTTNTAARLQGMTKDSGFAVFLADSTRSGLAVPAPDLEYVDELAIRGRQAKVRIWGLRAPGSSRPVEADRTGEPPRVSVS